MSVEATITIHDRHAGTEPVVLTGSLAHVPRKNEVVEMGGKTYLVVQVRHLLTKIESKPVVVVSGSRQVHLVLRATEPDAILRDRPRRER